MVCYFKRIILILLFVLFIYCLPSYCATCDSNYINMYIDDQLLANFYETDYYDDNYLYVIWAFRYNNADHYSIVAVDSSKFDYILDYNTSTGVFTYNPAIDDYYKYNDFTNISFNNSNFSHLTTNLASNGWFSQTNVRTPEYKYYSNVQRYFLWGSYNSIIFNGDKSNRVHFPSEITYSNIETPPLFDTDVEVGGSDLIFTYDYTFYNMVSNLSTYFNENYYRVIFGTPSGNNILYKVWFVNKAEYDALNKTQPPFWFYTTGSSRDIRIRSGSFTVYEYYWLNNGSATLTSSTFSNDEPSNTVKNIGNNTFLLWSNSESFRIWNGSNVQITFPDEALFLMPMIEGWDYTITNTFTEPIPWIRILPRFCY